jgi:hypothetical protein
MECRDVQGLPPQFSRGAPQFAPHASGAQLTEDGRVGGVSWN